MGSEFPSPTPHPSSASSLPRGGGLIKTLYEAAAQLQTHRLPPTAAASRFLSLADLG